MVLFCVAMYLIIKGAAKLLNRMTLWAVARDCAHAQNNEEINLCPTISEQVDFFTTGTHSQERLLAAKKYPCQECKERAFLL